ncbi:MAG: 16S rRNA (cytidine(1402)-2'-O)-methyltransferase [Patescibacteria group bacterium]|nr:16S rRNA (cytidine(1402)-2'-O)-methyltransferase [Patescibacteria group bacterium]
MGILYIVSTPIGNLQDITLRAINILKSVDVVLCEDTRVSGILLKKIYEDHLFQKRPKLVSYYEENEKIRIPMVIQFLRNGDNIALISDSGTPTISDPGFKLVREALVQGVKVESIPGPTSLVSALVTSGLPTDKFIFLGFLPKKKGHRKKILEALSMTLKQIKATVILFEAPHRLLELLAELRAVFSDIDIVVARELTKVHEEVKRGRISDLSSFYLLKKPKGEIVVLFNLGD